MAVKADGRIITTNHVRREMDSEQQSVSAPGTTQCFPKLRESHSATAIGWGLTTTRSTIGWNGHENTRQCESRIPAPCRRETSKAVATQQLTLVIDTLVS